MKIEYEGLNELRDRFARFPDKFNDGLKTTIWASLYKLWENVPPYPTAEPTSSYVRTGTLGRSLGSGFSGGKGGGKPSIWSVNQGSKMISGEFGTKLGYAPYIIGENEQARIHRERWWTIKTIADNSAQAIQGLFNKFVEVMAKWLDRQGSI